MKDIPPSTVPVEHPVEQSVNPPEEKLDERACQEELKGYKDLKWGGLNHDDPKAYVNCPRNVIGLRGLEKVAPTMEEVLGRCQTFLRKLLE